MLAYRVQAPQGAPRGTVVCLHGYPESSFMWRHLLPACAAAGWRALAPDLAGYGDSEPDPPHTWERHVEHVDAFITAHVGGEPVVLVLHDWGGLIGLRWACERPARLRGLVVANTGFFPEGRWHGLAKALRTPGQGEELVHNLTPEGFAGMLRAVTPQFTDVAINEYWRAFDGEVRRRGHLELYRSGDFEKLRAYEGCLADLDVPALVLWGAQDVFAPVSGAHRFMAELPQARLEILEDAGHFIFDERPDDAVASVLRLLGEVERGVAERDDRRFA
jgi:haloalkane dehalogenase